MFINVSVLAASLVLLCSSNAGIHAAPIASKHQQQQQKQEIQKRTPGWLPYGITTTEFLAATAVGVGAGGIITSALKALDHHKKPLHWNNGVDEDEKPLNWRGGAVEEAENVDGKKFVVINNDEAADGS